MTDDEADLRRWAGWHFGPSTLLTLPSGQILTADEANVMTGFYAPAVGEEWPEGDES